jgi:hypothetical protein
VVEYTSDLEVDLYDFGDEVEASAFVEFMTT